MDFYQITPVESGFTWRLSYLKKPPKMLYFYGKMPENAKNGVKSGRFPKEPIGRAKVVAIVGARKMTAYGESIAFKIARELAELGVIVVSGMAIGIDTAAHRGALAGGGKTVAFLGTGIDKIYPQENYDLFEEIIRTGGAVISEYGPGAAIGGRMKTTFLERNRLISGVADAVIVVEADVRSGSLNTAVHALEQGVPLFAVPGDLGRQMSQGCNNLFSKGAAAYTCVEDVLNVLFPGGVKHRAKAKCEFSGTEDEKIVVSAVSKGLYQGEEIIKFCCKKEADFDITRFNIAVTSLELKGVLKREYGNKWILA